MQTIELTKAGDRMDELNVKIDELRAEMRDGFKEVRAELKEVRAETRSEVRDLRVEINTRFDAVQTSITMVWATTIGGFVTLTAALIATHY